MGSSVEIKSSRSAWPIWWNSISTKNTKRSQVWWREPVIPATQEAEAGESPEPGGCKLQWAKMALLNSNLGNRARLCLKKKKPILWKITWQLLTRFNIHLFYDPTILTLSIYSRGEKAHVHTKTSTLMFIGILLIITKKEEHMKMPFTRWMHKQSVVHLFNRLLLCN